MAAPAYWSRDTEREEANEAIPFYWRHTILNIGVYVNEEDIGYRVYMHADGSVDLLEEAYSNKEDARSAAVAWLDGHKYADRTDGDVYQAPPDLKDWHLIQVLDDERVQYSRKVVYRGKPYAVDIDVLDDGFDIEVEHAPESDDGHYRHLGKLAGSTLPPTDDIGEAFEELIDWLHEHDIDDIRDRIGDMLD